MKVRFYSFSKRNNSTKVPANDATYQEAECRLKDRTSIVHPTLLIQGFVAAAYNYAYIPSWNRYYFISDAQSIENMWEVSLTEDYLGSYKEAIGLTSANVLYATGSTKSIVDSRIPVKSDVLIGHEYDAISDLTITDGNFGNIILGISGKGSFGTYVLQNAADLPDLLDGIDDFWSTDVQSQVDAAKQLFYGGSAGNCLKGAIGIPIAFSGSDVGTLENLYLGGYPCKRANGTSISGYRITNPILKGHGTITIPWQSSDWKKVANYSTVCCYFPLIGVISIPATEVQDETTLTYLYSINVTSGDIAFQVRTTTGNKILAVASSNCAISVPVGSTGIDTSKVNKAIVSGVGVAAAGLAAIATGGASLAVLGAIGGGLASLAGNTIGALGGSPEGSGGLGGGSSQGLDKVVHCYVIQKQLTDTQTNFNPLIGKPYMGVATIGSFSGFVQTDGFRFEHIQAYSSEKDMIDKLLDGGIYYE